MDGGLEADGAGRRTGQRCQSTKFHASSLRQRKNKLCPHAFRAHHIDIFPMGLYGFFDDGQSQPGSLFVLAPGEVGLVEAFPDLVQRIPWDSDAIIFYGGIDLVAPLRGLDGDGGIGLAELDGIVQQVVEDLLDLALVGSYV